MKRFILFLLLFFFILGLEGRACAECGKSITVNAVDHQRLKSKAHEAKAYCVSKGFSTNYCFLVDFSIHSGKKRFFVWDFKGDSIKYASLCAHGYGKDSTPSKPVFSNTPGSLCSSLGKYKVGIRAYSNGESMFIINCMVWNPLMIMLSNVLSYYILILLCLRQRFILHIFH